MRQFSAKDGRRGTILALFALLVFALMGMAALVVDIGYLYLARQEMQTAVDTAALEGLRFRDDASVVLTNPQDNQDPAKRDMARRQAASDLVAALFDDDLTPSNGDPQQFGAGPVLVYSGGVTLANALQTVSIPQPPFDRVYKPNNFSKASPTITFTQLQINETANERFGDMVAGTFTAPPTPPAEDPQYNRTDFQQSTPAVSPTAPAFLVRMRRTDDRNDNLNSVSGVSSRGPGMPLMFGRGTLIAGADPTTGYSPRFHGLTVRATAIANAVPARTVGPAYPQALYATAHPDFAGITGAAPFGLSLAFWNDPTFKGGMVTATVAANGSLSSPGIAGSGQLVRVTSLSADLQAAATSLTVASAAGFPTVAPPFSIRMDNEILQVTAVDPTGLTWSVARAQEGTTANPHQATVPILEQARLTMGQSVPSLASPQPTALNLLPGAAGPTPSAATFATFTPLFDDTTSLVVGFGNVLWSVSSWGSAGGFTLTLSRQAGAIAPRNATAVFAAPAGLTSAQLTQLFAAQQTLPDSILVPALVR